MSEVAEGPTLSWPKILLAWCVAVLILEGMSLVSLTLLSSISNVQIRTKQEILRDQVESAREILDASKERTALDPVLGWTYRAGFVSDSDAINHLGARSRRNYSQDPEEGATRILAFGDSFMYGNEVSVEEVWSTLLEDSNPRFEVLNFGVGGYGTDQAFLRYLRKRDRFGEKFVLIGFAPVNLRRAVNVYRRFISDREIALVKPRFSLTDSEELNLHPNPLPTPQDYRLLVDKPVSTVLSLGEHDFWFEPLIWRNPVYDLSAMARLTSFLAARIHRTRLSGNRLLRRGIFNDESEAFAVQVRIISSFVDSVAASGVTPLVVIFPDRGSIERIQAQRTPVYQPLLDELEAERIAILDLSHAFTSEVGTNDPGPWFAPGGHYSPKGNRVVADAIRDAVLAAGFRRSCR